MTPKKITSPSELKSDTLSHTQYLFSLKLNGRWIGYNIYRWNISEFFDGTFYLADLMLSVSPDECEEIWEMPSIPGQTESTWEE